MRLLFLFISAAVFFSAAAGAPLAQEPAKAGPIVEIKERLYDFGEIPEGEVVAHAFTVVNRGSALLKIEKIQPD